MHKIDNHSELKVLPADNEEILVTMKGGSKIKCTYYKALNKFTYEAIDRVTKSKALVVVNPDEIYGWEIIEKKSKKVPEGTPLDAEGNPMQPLTGNEALTQLTPEELLSKESEQKELNKFTPEQTKEINALKSEEEKKAFYEQYGLQPPLSFLEEDDNQEQI